MGISFNYEKAKNTKTRKFPYLPRFGVFLDVGGRTFVYKQTPVLETLANLIERGVNLANLLKINKEQFSEIQFPREKKPRIIKTSAKTISVKRR